MATWEDLVAVTTGFPEESHKLKTSVTKIPVETGFNVSDHAFSEPVQLELEGWVSDVDGGANAQLAWQILQTLNVESNLLTVVTDWSAYDNMIITEVDAQRQSNGMTYTVKLQQVIVVGVSISQVFEPEPRGPAVARDPLRNHGLLGSAIFDFIPPDPAPGLLGLSIVEFATPTTARTPQEAAEVDNEIEIAANRFTRFGARYSGRGDPKTPHHLSAGAHSRGEISDNATALPSPQISLVSIGTTPISTIGQALSSSNLQYDYLRLAALGPF